MKFLKTSVFEMTLYDTILFGQNIPDSSLSVNENFRSPSIVVVELLHLHPSFSHSGPDNRLKLTLIQLETNAHLENNRSYT